MKNGLDAYKLKLIALLFMILDHVHTHLWFYGSTPQWISVITRFVSPLFLYLMIEGFYHTRSRKKYLIRLSVAALVMLIGNISINLFFHNVNPDTGRYRFFTLIGPNNIFMTLALLFGFVWCLENIKQRKNVLLSCFLAKISAFVCLFSEGGIFLLPVAIIIWFFRGKKHLQCIGIVALSIALFIQSITSYTGATTMYSHLCFNNEWGMFLVIPFILLYNGKRGRNTAFSKYLFYIIYPAHIWLFVILNFIFGR